MRWGVGEIIDNLVAIKKPSQKNHLLNDEQEAPACLLFRPRRKPLPPPPRRLRPTTRIRVSAAFTSGVGFRHPPPGPPLISGALYSSCMIVRKISGDKTIWELEHLDIMDIYIYL